MILALQTDKSMFLGDDFIKGMTKYVIAIFFVLNVTFCQ